MKVICPQCKKEHNIDESKIPVGATVAQCRACGHRFPLFEPAPTAPEPEAPKTGPRRIGVTLSKGGVGKTTTSVNLAAGLALAGYKVLLVDTDTQGQASYLLGQKPQAGLTELVTGELPAAETIVQARENLWLLAGGRSLAGVKRMIDRKDFGGELTLVEALEPVEKDFDFVIVDTSPGWDPLTVNVLFYVFELITPVSLEVMTLQGLVEFLKNLSSIQKYRSEVTLNYILPTFLDKRIKNPDAILDKLKDLYGEYVCTPIRYNVRLSESPAYGKTIFEYAPGSHGSQDYRDLVRKITDRPELFS